MNRHVQLQDRQNQGAANIADQHDQSLVEDVCEPNGLSSTNPNEWWRAPLVSKLQDLAAQCGDLRGDTLKTCVAALMTQVTTTLVPAWYALGCPCNG